MGHVEMFFFGRMQDLLRPVPQGAIVDKHGLGISVFPSTARVVEVRNTFRKKTEIGM